MSLIFGLDIGTTSIGFAVVEHDVVLAKGKIHRLGVRIFPEARDPKGTPLNQERRSARLRRRQLRRRRERRRLLGELLAEAGLLPPRGSTDWEDAMKADPYELRKRAFEEGALNAHEIGRAIYHLAKRRHFKGREIEEVSDSIRSGRDGNDDNGNSAASARRETVRALESDGKTLGAWLAARKAHDRKKGEHATRVIVADEFDRVWAPLVPEPFRSAIRDAIFFQRPVFWRLSTLGQCRFIPDAPPCPRASWLSQQRRMLEKLNNISLTSAISRPLDDEERREILARLQTQTSMSWPRVRRSLAQLYQDRGIPGAEQSLRFNLEDGGEKNLLGNSIEAKLADIFGNDWQNHPDKQSLRESIPDKIRQADFQKIGDQRVVIVSAEERRKRRKKAALRLKEEFRLTDDQAKEIEKLKLPLGWEPYSVKALQAILPHLENGTRFGEIVSGHDLQEWRAAMFPDHIQPTKGGLHRLPSPAVREECERVAALRNPTVARTRNELRKVINNLVDMFGKPDLIRVEVARDVGNSKRQREDRAAGIRHQEKRRQLARANLEKNKIYNPSKADVEKWMLWEECGRRCPYTGDSISFDALFLEGRFEVEHIWPRSRSLDNSFRNKTLCRRDKNVRKANQTPYELFHNCPQTWRIVCNRVDSMKATQDRFGMSPGKIRRFKAPSIPDDFVARQLNDTGYAARQAVAFMKMLWPDFGPTAPVKVQAVSGRVTAQVRRLWGLNNILAEGGEKTREDHRHHAIDALTVSCCDPGITQRLSRYWQAEDTSSENHPHLPPPWGTIRGDAKTMVATIIVSHRVRRKLSGSLHKETVYGDTGEDDSVYRYFVFRKNVEELSNADLAENSRDLWPDQDVREIVETWVNTHGDGNPSKAFPPYPRRGRKGPEIRKVRLYRKWNLEVMARVSTGYAELGNNHHISLYRSVNGTVAYEVVSLLEASRRLRRGESIVRREREDGATFVMSLGSGDALQFTRNGATKVRIVKSVWSDGQVVVVDHEDATSKGASGFRPRASTIVRNGRKLSVDPIGRIRQAND